MPRYPRNIHPKSLPAERILPALSKDKEEEIRKYSIIYGRFDSKRREGKQLSLHEVRTPACQDCLGHLELDLLTSENPHIWRVCFIAP